MSNDPKRIRRALLYPPKTVWNKAKSVVRGWSTYWETPVPDGSPSFRASAYLLRAVYGVGLLAVVPLTLATAGLFSFLLAFFAPLLLLGGIAKFAQIASDPSAGIGDAGTVLLYAGAGAGLIVLAVAFPFLLASLLVVPAGRVYQAWVQRQEGRVWKLRVLSVALGVGGTAGVFAFRDGGPGVASSIAGISTKVLAQSAAGFWGIAGLILLILSFFATRDSDVEFSPVGREEDSYTTGSSE